MIPNLRLDGGDYYVSVREVWESGVMATENVTDWYALRVSLRPPAGDEETEPDEGVGAGLRVGIIARESSDEAWTLARARFPEDRRGQLTRQLATKVSDSVWHRQLSELAAATATGDHPYWLIPFENYKTMCPYLVGSYDRVGEELARYIALGYRSFILDIPPDEDELRYANTAFQQALERVA